MTAKPMWYRVAPGNTTDTYRVTWSTTIGTESVVVAADVLDTLTKSLERLGFVPVV